MSKILWIGDAVVSSGFSKCTHAVCDYLHSQGYEINILGINYFGDLHNYPYNIHPCIQPLDNGTDGFGVHRLPRMIERLNPDVIVLLNDPWNVQEYFDYFHYYNNSRVKFNIEPLRLPPVIGWLAVDSKNQPGNPLNLLSHVVTWTEFGAGELKLGGYKGDSSVVPLGVDRSIYYPRDKVESRKLTCPEQVKDTDFIVGYVGRNQLRKRIDLLIQYFAEWTQKNGIDNAWLYIHTAPTGDKNGCDIINLVKYYDLLNRVIIARPEVGYGVDQEYLSNVYNSFDVFATMSQAEGFCLPVLESISCGTPAIVPSWAGLGNRGWTEDAVVQVNCTSNMLTAPLNGECFTIGGIADKKTFIEELDAMYQSKVHRDHYVKMGLKLADQLSWEETGRKFKEVIDKVITKEDELRKKTEDDKRLQEFVESELNKVTVTVAVAETVPV